MKKAFLATAIYVSITLPVWGQNQENLITGQNSGQNLGQQAFLLNLMNRPQQALRIGLLPINTLNVKTKTRFSQTQILKSLSDQSSHHWQALENSPDTLYNLSLQQLADQKRLDALLVLEVQKNEQDYWVLCKFYSGVNGQVLSNEKLRLTEFNTPELSQQILNVLNSHPMPRIYDFNRGQSELRLHTIPGELYVALNHQAVGLSPLIIRNLAPGSHQIHLTEYQDFTIQRLQVLTTPPGVSVKWNGKVLGKTPLNLDPSYRQAGEHELELSGKENFRAEIRIQSEPENLKVQLGDLPIQRTPVSFQALREKRYRLKIWPYISTELTKNVEIPPDSNVTLDINAYKYAKLIIDTSIANAKLHIDDEHLGQTPFSTQLPQGLHTLKISKNRYRSIEKTIDLQPGKTESLHFELMPRSADTSIFLTPTGEITPQLNIGTKYLGFGNIIQNPGANEVSELAHLYGLEVDYGWPNLYSFNQSFELGLEISAFMYALQSASFLRPFPGLGTKLQFLKEGDRIPISAALGSYLSLDLNNPQWVGYLSLSRNFGDFALHLGLQTHGFNLNLGYTGWDNLRLGALVYADSFLRLLSLEGEGSTTFYGLQVGYSF